MSPRPSVLILDYGSQYTQLIARRVRESQVYCEILPGTATLDEVTARAPSALILSGGPSHRADPSIAGVQPPSVR
jgi:GMP synthase (glutamine-hydrolysing)